eukprot:CAMPEP_0115079226 /NCGR_PEP_ID=MMETSP0227-20121206/17984_1 /TAXON_ID=89957 /ORGANISM="Polarella glacialis, Strain CCMP 1383" /LENGTH=500 /DNA_ID=CAMNT_0002466693 /DNA_START=96 /DNA_END=1598 /DNA_ORIENTATION=+
MDLAFSAGSGAPGLRSNGQVPGSTIRASKSGLLLSPETSRTAESPEAKNTRGLSDCSLFVPSVLTGLAAASAGRRRQRRQRSTPTPPRARGGEQVATLPAQDQWIAQMNLEAFGKDVHELGERLKAEQTEKDQKHLYKMITWSRLCAAVGLGTMWMRVNPVSAFFISLWIHSAWTMMGHHVTHGGYNRTDQTGRYSSRGFALATLRRRVMDWFDWMLPEAWSVEHNQLHHYRLGEDSDPDLLERNAAEWKGLKRKVMPIISMFLWKWAYYSPNTFKELKCSEMRQQKIPFPEGYNSHLPLTLSGVARGDAKGIFTKRELFFKVLGPYFLWHFFLLPLPLALINPAFYWNAVGNLFLADVFSNLHGFIVVVPNHAGDDLYKFGSSCKPKSPTFYLRAVTSSANFATGGDVNDFMHGWLNYQIEHHCWPDLSMLSYQKGQPALKKICETYGVPYVQESVWIRTKKTMDIAMGFTKMREYPQAWEREADRMVWKDSKKDTVVA